MRGKKKFLFSFKAIVLTFYFLIVVFPIYWVVITSFKPSAEILDRSVITYFPHTFTTENYSTLFRMMDYGVYIKNSIDFSVSFYNYHEPSIYPCL